MFEWWNCVVKTISQLATKLPLSVLARTTDIFHISILSCHTSGTYWILMYDIRIFAIICTYHFILDVVLSYYSCVKIIIIIYIV